MRHPRLLMPPEMDGLYHVVSRVVDRRMIFGEEEKKRFRDLLVAYAGFSGIEVVAWCLMDNHFHLLLHVPSRVEHDPAKLPEDEVLRRLRLIYKEPAVKEIERILGLCVDVESRRRYLEQFTKRMGDLPMFMRTLKQRFSRWYNLRQNRKGTLWEDRYRSVVVEIQGNATLGHAARIVAAYIDLNPVRAGMVEDPKDYSWCGYGRAVVGEKDCVRGVTRLWGASKGEDAAMAEYRMFLFEEGSEEKVEDLKDEGGRPEDGETGKSQIQDPRTGEMKTWVGIDARKVWEERERGGRLPLRVILRLKSRYLVDGAAIGSAEFIRRLTGGSGGLDEEDREDTPEADGTGGEPIAAATAASSDAAAETAATSKGRDGALMRFGQWGGLRVLRDLRVRVVG